MLHRRKCIYLISYRQYDNSSRMLSCGSSYIYAAFGNPFYLVSSLYNRSSKLFTLFFKIFVYKTLRRLFSNSTNCSGFKCLSFSKYNLCICMCFTLVFIRKVKIDIRLFITLKSQECLKRYIKSHLI